MALIELEAAESAIAKLMPSFTTPDGSGQLDEIIFYAQQICADAIETIRELPTIDAAPVVHGRWAKHDGYTECSECEYWYDSAESEDAGDRPNYCPNCGARMDGG